MSEKRFLQLIVVWAALFAVVPMLHAKDSPIAESEQPYARALSRVWAATIGAPIAAQWCATKFPAHKADIEVAVSSWERKFGELVDDLNRRMLALVRVSGKTPPDRAEAVLESFRNSFRVKYDEGMLSSSPQRVAGDCGQAATELTSDSFNPELKFAAELELIRAHPLEVATITQD